MAWIEQVSERDATGPIAAIYKSAQERAGGIANIIRVMSLRPKLLNTFMRFYVDLMQGDSTLSRSDRELLATVTSGVNECFY
ncbi:MAG: peroxidase [Planctomycetota bacterium]